ncbi:plasmid mobilization protein [Bacteroides xylanisolvens]|uniref:plasmid mobilization protein n=1 Tax=Bacteroides xylanisolvens TaxID=371601 RepID=UPI00293D7ACB|nr:mobilization protein [Bacteroides xylanisolvens]
MTDNDNSHKGGRPKSAKGKARTKTISTRLTLAEWKAVMKRIADAGKKPSHFLRELLLQGKVEAARTQEDRRQIRMLEGGCNNLNQLAKLAHQQGFSLLKGKIINLLDEFNKIIERI